MSRHFVFKAVINLYLN